MGYIFVSQMTSRKWSTDCKETKMKIDPNRLRTLRQRKKLSRPDLERAAGITVRTIQRLENEPDESKTTREDTVLRLAKALDVEPGVLTGELALLDAEKAPVAEPDPVRIGAQIAPKVRLAYDLIKRRYGVNATDLINMAPLFFTLLAEGSLAWRRRKLKRTKRRGIRRLSKMQDEIGNRMFGLVAEYAYEAYLLEKESIGKADLFSDHLFDDHGYAINDLCDVPVDSTKENPFANYLRKLTKDLPDTGIVSVDEGTLNISSDFRFPYYDICKAVLNKIANDSEIARSSLETGYARLSEIPEKLNAQVANEERQKWLEERLPDNLRDSSEKDRDLIRKVVSMHPTDERSRNFLEEGADADHENGGDEQ